MRIRTPACPDHLRTPVLSLGVGFAGCHGRSASAQAQRTPEDRLDSESNALLLAQALPGSALHRLWLCPLRDSFVSVWSASRQSEAALFDHQLHCQRANNVPPVGRRLDSEHEAVLPHVAATAFTRFPSRVLKRIEVRSSRDVCFRFRNLHHRGCSRWGCPARRGGRRHRSPVEADSKRICGAGGSPRIAGAPTASTARASEARRSRARSTAVSEAALLCPSPLRRPVAPTVPAYSVPADPLASGHPWGCSAYRGLRLRPGMTPGCPNPTVGITGTVSRLSFRVSSALTVPALATTITVGTAAYPARR